MVGKPNFLPLFLQAEKKYQPNEILDYLITSIY